MKKKGISIILVVTLMMTASTVTSFSATYRPTPPKTVSVKNVDDNYLKVSWSKSKTATKYAVYRSTSKTGTYKKLTTTKYRYYNDKTVKNKKTYYYKVRALGENGLRSSYSLTRSGKITFDGKISVNLEFDELSLGMGEVRMAYVTVSGCDDEIVAYFDDDYIDIVWNQGIDGEYPLEIWVNDCKPFPYQTKIVFKFANHERLYSKTLYFTIDGWS